MTNGTVPIVYATLKQVIFVYLILKARIGHVTYALSINLGTPVGPVPVYARGIITYART